MASENHDNRVGPDADIGDRAFERMNFDALTGLATRRLFLDRLRGAMALAQRKGQSLAVLLVDINALRSINDGFGEAGGDRMLQISAQRLVGSVRESDIAGRVSGDQFAVVLTELRSGTEAALVARKLLEELSRPCDLSGKPAVVTASIGISCFPDDSDADLILGHAETALRYAKESGHNSYRFFTAAMNEDAQARVQLDNDLRLALARNEFLLHYQPKISCTSGEIVGMEALLRWQHPTRGLVPPASFVPALEDNGLINSVGKWVLFEACRQLQAWVQAGLDRPSVAVNISARQFESGNMVALVREALETSGLAPDRLELELTETVLMHNVERVIATLNELRQTGIRIVVDDFGTGYSSLSYLRRFPLDAIKVDRSFVQDITTSPEDVSIARIIIAMAHNLNLKVVAEGVETTGQLAFLAANHCDEIQGFYFSRPVPAEEMGKILADRCVIPSLPINPEQQKRTLLLVDDEENILASLRRLLRRDGYRILTADSGNAGLELLAENRVDVIVSDQRMPGMTGVEFLRRVKTMHPETVRLVLSGYTELQSITDAINEGAIYKFLTKPWDDDLLRANIEEAFRHKELADENRRLNAEIQVVNRELAQANAKLLKTLEEKERRIERDETVLSVVHDVLECMPFPVVGVDGEGLVVFANEEALSVVAGGNSIVGSHAAVLPSALAALLGGVDGESARWSGWLAICRHLDEVRRTGGRVLILLPERFEQ